MALPDHYDAAEEAGLIKAYYRWPLWPVLPVKKVGANHECGIVVTGDLSTVVLMNLFDLKTGPINEQTKDAERIQYESVEAMVADGWIGD